MNILLIHVKSQWNCLLFLQWNAKTAFRISNLSLTPVYRVIRKVICYSFVAWLDYRWTFKKAFLILNTGLFGTCPSINDIPEILWLLIKKDTRVQILRRLRGKTQQQSFPGRKRTSALLNQSARSTRPYIRTRNATELPENTRYRYHRHQHRRGQKLPTRNFFCGLPKKDTIYKKGE